MSIKVLSAKLKNYGPISELKCDFFDGVTTFVGLNGSGKSKILESVVACVKGIASKKGGIVGDRYRFIGSNGKSSDVEFEFVDEKTAQTFFIKNHITKTTNQITIRSNDGGDLGEEWLRCFMNVSLMSATAFSQLSGKEQAELLGIDVSSFDNELTELKRKATDIRVEIKAMGTITEIDPVEKIDIKALQEQESKIQSNLEKQYMENRNENERRRHTHKNSEDNADKIIREWHDECEKRQENITLAQSCRDRLVELGLKDDHTINDIDCFIESMPHPELEPNHDIPELVLIEPEYPDSTELKEIREKINTAWENNAQYQKYIEYQRKHDVKKGLEKKLIENKENQDQCIVSRNAYLASHDYGFKGLSVDDSGALVLSVRGEEPRPLRQPHFSKGEMEMIMAQLHIAMNPEFKVRFIDDFECITEPNDEKILNMLLDAGFQVIVAEARKPGKRDNEIVIKESRIDNNETDERPEML